MVDKLEMAASGITPCVLAKGSAGAVSGLFALAVTPTGVA